MKFDSFGYAPEGLGVYSAYRQGAYNIRLELYDGRHTVDFIPMLGPLTPTKPRDLEGFAFGQSYRDANYASYSGGREVNFYTILYGETDDAPAVFIVNMYRYERYETTTKVAKVLIDVLNKHTVINAVAEVTMGPRKAQGPATEEGKTPRDPTFEKLPQDITWLVKEFVGKQRGGKTRRRKTKTSRRRKTRARRVRS